MIEIDQGIDTPISYLAAEHDDTAGKVSVQLIDHLTQRPILEYQMPAHPGEILRNIRRLDVGIAAFAVADPLVGLKRYRSSAARDLDSPALDHDRDTVVLPTNRRAQ